ncbi:MAG: glycoside hydrolase family 16 protein [Clostridiales bacterium]|nr:glycoside hydrolase family 16 protein [Clostridiales bacterium]
MKLPKIKHVFENPILGKLANYLTAFVSALLLIVNVRNVNMNSTPIDLNDYELVFSDEFDGDKVNTDIWDVHNSAGIRKGGYWTFDQASVRDGNLVIRTEYKEDGAFGAGWYTCGLATQHRFEHKYGYYECRCILPKGKGMWSAFWLMNPNVNKTNGHGREGSEIDIFESPYYFLPGKASRLVTSNIHYNGYELKTKYRNVVISKLDNDPYENYNTYGLLWTPEEYIFYVNGHEVGRSKFGGVSQAEEYLILSCEIDGAAASPTYGWSGHIKQNGGEDFSAEFLVDYVRVYDAVK